MDAATLERCAKGEASAWEALVQAHERRVFNMCYRFTQNSSDAQDLTQEVFLRVFRTVRSFRASGGDTAVAFQTWMARLTRNLLIDSYRRKKLDRLMEQLEPRLARMKEKAAGCSGPDGMLAAREFRERLDAEMRRLTPELRQTLGSERVRVYGIP